MSARADTAVLLSFAGAHVGYDDGPVVRDADLHIRGGEIVGLVGPNGAGKSTMLRAVTGAARVWRGAVAVAGKSADSLTARERARLVGVVPQSLVSSFAFTAREFVEMGRHPWLGRLERSSGADDAIVSRALSVTDTARLSAERVDELSGGDLQRLALAQALAQEPEVLLLDEPTSHLDLNHRLQILDLVRELADGGMAVLAVFHDLDLAARYSDRLAVVAQGAVGPVGPPRQVLTPSLVADVFAVKAVVGTDPVTGAVVVTPILRDEAVAGPRREGVFLVSGSGTGAPLMRRLALAGFRVTCGALNRGDTDQAVAEALGLPHVALSPFGEIDERVAEEVGRLAAEADVRVVVATPFGAPNLGNLEAVVRAPGPVVLVGELAPDDDFTDGRARELWAAAAAGGGIVVDGDDGVPEAIELALGGRTGPD